MAVMLHNTNRTIPVEVKSADGDSVMIMPLSKQPVDDKFAKWHLPRDVRIVKASHTTFGKKRITTTENEANTEAQSANISQPRDTVKTYDTPTSDSSKPKSTRNHPQNPNPAAQNKKDNK